MTKVVDLLRERLPFLRKHAVRVPNKIVNTPRKIVSELITYSSIDDLFWIQGVFYPVEEEYSGEGLHVCDARLISPEDKWKYSSSPSKAETITAIYELTNELVKQYGAKNFKIWYGTCPEFRQSHNFVTGRKYNLSLSILGTQGADPNAYAHISYRGKKVAHVVIPQISFESSVPTLEQILNRGF